MLRDNCSLLINCLSLFIRRQIEQHEKDQNQILPISFSNKVFYCPRDEKLMMYISQRYVYLTILRGWFITFSYRLEILLTLTLRDNLVQPTVEFFTFSRLTSPS